MLRDRAITWGLFHPSEHTAEGTRSANHASELQLQKAGRECDIFSCFSDWYYTLWPVPQRSSSFVLHFQTFCILCLERNYRGCLAVYVHTKVLSGSETGWKPSPFASASHPNLGVEMGNSFLELQSLPSQMLTIQPILEVVHQHPFLIRLWKTGMVMRIGKKNPPLISPKYK